MNLLENGCYFNYTDPSYLREFVLIRFVWNLKGRLLNCF